MCTYCWWKKSCSRYCIPLVTGFYTSHFFHQQYLLSKAFENSTRSSRFMPPFSWNTDEIVGIFLKVFVVLKVVDLVKSTASGTCSHGHGKSLFWSRKYDIFKLCIFHCYVCMDIWIEKILHKPQAAIQKLGSRLIHIKNNPMDVSHQNFISNLPPTNQPTNQPTNFISNLTFQRSVH